MSNKLAIVIAVVLGIVAAVAVRAYLEREREKQAGEYRTTAVVVARRIIRQGEALNTSQGENAMVATRQFPERMIKTGMITPAELRRFKGYVARDRIEAGAPLFRQDLTPPIERADLDVNVVPEGMRAISIPVTMETGVAGLIQVGDFVDVVGTFKRRAGGGAVTVYLYQKARVLALDNKTAASVRTESRSGRVYRTVTLEVPPEDALRLINAQRQGEIQLMLRHRRDKAEAESAAEGKLIGVDVLGNELETVAPHTEVAPANPYGRTR